MLSLLSEEGKHCSKGSSEVSVSHRIMGKAHHATEEAMSRGDPPPSMSVKKWKGGRVVEGGSSHGGAKRLWCMNYRAIASAGVVVVVIRG